MQNEHNTFDFAEILDEDFDPLYDDGSFLAYEQGLEYRAPLRVDQFE